MNDEEIRKSAQRFIQKNGELLVNTFASDAIYKPDDFPVTVFMAGCPGAGKTEVSIGLVEQFTSPAVRIDADEIRKLCDGYTGVNAHLFQSAASIGVETLYNYCLEQKFNMVVDGTFAHQKTVSNIEKSLKHGRKVIIYFVYQDPQVAWDFTKKREGVAQRRVTKESFVKGYCMSRVNVNEAKRQFGNQIELNLLVKNLANDDVSTIFKDITVVDLYLKKIYTESELNNAIV
ncbi:MAG: zeta toxin family protein [Candidatus Moranbacteria bacterium]|nr:zeta toxin family protein [Candidatus Moranbacteria bacterium]